MVFANFHWECQSKHLTAKYINHSTKLHCHDSLWHFRSFRQVKTLMLDAWQRGGEGEEVSHVSNKKQGWTHQGKKNNCANPSNVWLGVEILFCLKHAKAARYPFPFESLTLGSTDWDIPPLPDFFKNSMARQLCPALALYLSDLSIFAEPLARIGWWNCWIDDEDWCCQKKRTK